MFFVRDLGFALASPRVGAIIYNPAHGYAGPLTLSVAALAAETTPMWGLIWAAHIGFDRALGYGLKYPSAFADTHLGRIGRPR